MSIATDFQDFRAKKLAKEFTAFRKESMKGADGQAGKDGKSVALEEVVEALMASPTFLGMIKGKDGQDGRDGLTEVIENTVREEVDEQKILEAVRKFMPMGGLGVSPTIVNNIANRVTALENNPSGGLQYTLINTIGTTTYTADDFIFGTNIIGVNAAGAVTIRLPDNLTTGTIVTVNDESLLAGTNNITVTTYKV